MDVCNLPADVGGEYLQSCVPGHSWGEKSPGKAKDLSTAVFSSVTVPPVAKHPKFLDVFFACLRVEHAVIHGGTVSAVVVPDSASWQLEGGQPG